MDALKKTSELALLDVQDGGLLTEPPDVLIDKSGWGDGPWQDEPDYERYVLQGFPCVIMRSIVGMLCGYVAVPSVHPWYRLSPEELPVRVHGGCEFRKYGNDQWLRSEEDDVAWFGFSCSHLGDYLPVDGLVRRELRRADPDKWEMDLVPNHYVEKNYKTIDFVRKEVAKLVAGAVHARSGR